MATRSEGTSRIRQRLRERRRQSAIAAGQQSLPLDVKPNPPDIVTPLGQREHDYATRLKHVRLVGELNLSGADFQRLTEEMVDVRSRTSESYALAKFQRDFPAVLAVFLVNCGIYDYEAGDLWTGAFQRLELSVASLGPKSAEVGKFFERFLEESNLETFDQFSEKAQRYVSRILAHGGIPNYCLDDFFNLLAHTLHRPELAVLPPAVLVEEWRSSRYSRYTTIDVPIRRFLTHGGPVAEDFLQRALDMTSSALRTGTVPAPAAVGLPERIIERFEAWFVTARDRQPRGEYTVSRRIQQPRITLDPWSRDGLLVEFPSQTISTTGNVVEWIVQADSVRTAVTARSERLDGSTIFIRAASSQIRQPSNRYIISLHIDGQPQARWTIPGITRERPYIAFDPTNGRSLQWVGELPRKEIWLLAPGKPNIAPHAIVEMFPEMVSDWKGYRAFHVDLSNVDTIPLELSPELGADIQSPTIRVARRQLRPELTDIVTPIKGVTSGGGQHQVYPQPPTISIPAVASDASFQSALWNIVIEPLPGAVPTHAITENVSHLTWSEAADNSIVLSLHQKRLLPSTALGQFAVSIHGPLGQDAAFEVAIVPGLHLEGRENPLSRGVSADNTMNIRLFASCPLHVRAPGTGTDIHGEAQRFAISTTETEVALLVSPGVGHPLGIGDGAFTELEISTPILRWALLGAEHQNTLPWSQNPVTVSTDELDIMSSPALLIEGYQVTDKHNRTRDAGTATLELRNSSGATLMTSAPTEVRGHRLWMDLAPFRDTLRTHADKALQFILNIRSNQDKAIVVDIPLVRVTQTLTIQRLAIAEQRTVVTPDGPMRKLHVTWKQPYPVADRRLRIWSLSRIWSGPVEIDVPDDARGQHMVSASIDELPVGAYRLEMVAVDPWSFADEELTPPLPPMAPQGGRRGHLDIQIGDSFEIMRLHDEAPRSVADVIAYALLLESSTHLNRIAHFTHGIAGVVDLTSAYIALHDARS